MIARRHVFLIIGYAPIAPETQHLWFKRSFAKFGQLWRTSGTVSDIDWDAEHRARWRVETHGSNWRVATTYEPLNWDDIIHSDMAQPVWSQVTGSILTFFEFLLNGTLVRYFRAHWTYGLFFLLPYFHIALFAALASLAGYWTARLTDPAGWIGVLAGCAAGVAAFVGLLYWPGKRWHTQHILVDWIFSRDYARNRRRDMTARLDQFARRIVERVRANSADEILVVGHCLGAGLAAVTLARALELDPDLGRHGAKLGFLTIGATLPKFALHPGGTHVRAAARRVAAEPAIQWAEYHSREDAVSFYKFDPVALERATDRIDKKPIIRRVKLRDMVEKPTWRRIRWRFLRMHLQGFLANERRTAYDYFMFVCGPIPFADATVAPGGPMSYIAEDGAYSASPRALPAVESGVTASSAEPMPDVVRAEEMP